MPGSWSYLSGASTWGGGQRLPPGRTGAGGWPLGCGWDRSPQRQSHTLPRVNKSRKEAPLPYYGLPQHTLPAGWGFSHAAGWPGALGKRSKVGGVGGGSSSSSKHNSRDPLPKWKEPSPSRERTGGNLAAAAAASSCKSTPQSSGGLFVIDATCVVIQAHYIPPPRTLHVRYLGQEAAVAVTPRAEQVKAATARCSPSGPAGSMEERASRILGLPRSELFLPEAGGESLPPEAAGPKAEESCPAEVTVPAEICGAGQSVAGAPSPRGSPRNPAPAPSSFQPAPIEQGPPGCPKERGEGGGGGCLSQGEGAEPSLTPTSRSYVRDLKEAMSRIRRHTAPDSDTDEELEDCQAACGVRRPLARRGRSDEGAGTLFCSSSSSSLESSGSNTTVVPGNATPTFLGNGPHVDSELMREVTLG